MFSIAKTEDPVVTGLSADVPMIIKDEEPAPTEGKFYSEEELMKLKKINFKKKVTGEFILLMIFFSQKLTSMVFFTRQRKACTSKPKAFPHADSSKCNRSIERVAW